MSNACNPPVDPVNEVDDEAVVEPSDTWHDEVQEEAESYYGVDQHNLHFIFSFFLPTFNMSFSLFFPSLTPLSP